MRISVVQFGNLHTFKHLTTGNEFNLASLDGDDDWLSLSMKNHKEYCDLHGYSYFFHELEDFPNDRNISWYKIPAILSAFAAQDDVDIEIHEPQWVFYCDLDTLVMNKSVELEDIINRAEFLGKDLILPKNKNFKSRTMNSKEKNIKKGINFGQFFIKNCAWSKLWLSKLWQFPLNYINHLDLLKTKYHDNCACNIMLKSNIFETKNNSILVANKLFNSYLNEIASSRESYLERQEYYYKDGDFKIHFADIDFETRQERMTEYYMRCVENK